MAIQARAGGGAIALGNIDHYDGLVEHEVILWEEVELDGDGHELSRSAPKSPNIVKGTLDPAFGDGSHLDLQQQPVDPKTGLSMPPQYGARVDRNGEQLWREALPIDLAVDACSDATDGTVIVLGMPHVPGQSTPSDGGTVFKIGTDGVIRWQVTLH
jgi:hypothetical protein